MNKVNANQNKMSILIYLIGIEQPMIADFQKTSTLDTFVGMFFWCDLSG